MGWGVVERHSTSCEGPANKVKQLGKERHKKPHSIRQNRTKLKSVLGMFKGLQFLKLKHPAFSRNRWRFVISFQVAFKKCHNNGNSSWTKFVCQLGQQAKPNLLHWLLLFYPIFVDLRIFSSGFTGCSNSWMTFMNLRIKWIKDITTGIELRTSVANLIKPLRS